MVPAYGGAEPKFEPSAQGQEWTRATCREGERISA